ncbi:MAG: protein kinase [Deltaproteobacteria bacterium]|nr:protein kinase [Deltaproteobacteria bacterium]
MLEGAFRHAPLARFTPLQTLSRDGMPELHLAKTKAGALVVVKVLVDAPIPADIGAGLARETALASRLEHEAVAQTRAIVLSDDVAAIVSEFVPGVSLQRLLRFAAERGVRLPDNAGWYIVERVLAALAHAHAQKDANGTITPIVHGSVGPQTVVVGWDGTTKLVDFGEAKMRSLVSPLVKSAPADHAVDAPLVSPEQARGGAVTDRADVFCAALIAMRIATGRTPFARFRHSAAERLIAISEADVTPLAKTRPDLPAAVREAFGRAIAADPAQRAVSAKELHAAVKASFDLAAGRAALVKLLERWRQPLESAMSPWEKRASMHDGAAPAQEIREGALALATADDRPSSDALVAAPEAADEPWRKDAVPSSEAPLAPTDPLTSMSRVGSLAPEALAVPLPAVRMTMPSLPTYDAGLGPKPPPPEEKVLKGRGAAILVFAVFVLLVAGSVFLLKWLSGPPGPG